MWYGEGIVVLFMVILKLKDEREIFRKSWDVYLKGVEKV